MPTTTLTSKGQTTIPKKIRDYLLVEAGDRLEFIIDGKGRVILLPATLAVTSIKGIFGRPKRPATIEEMKAAIRTRGTRKGRAG